jgi:hypothetical protein
MTLRYELRDAPRDKPSEVFEQLLALVKVGVHEDGDRIAIDRAILRQLSGTWAAQKLRRTQRRDLLGALGLPAAMIVAVADTSLTGIDDAMAALARQASATEFNVDLVADGALPSRRVVTVVEGRIAERDLEAAIARLPASDASELVIEPRPDPAIPEVPELDAAALGIVAVDATHFTIPDKLREELLADPAKLAKSARIVPSVVDGSVVGFKLYGIRRGSLPKAFGLKNGDTITAVNGIDLTGADVAIEAYGKLRKAKTLVVEIERKGAPLTLTLKFE